jgi:hypothetical protein
MVKMIYADSLLNRMATQVPAKPFYCPPQAHHAVAILKYIRLTYLSMAASWISDSDSLILDQ